MTDSIFELAGQVVRRALECGVSISAAESCTGGLIGASITEIAGSSSVFFGSAVTYHNSAKENILGIMPCVLEKYGAVSPQCAVQMAHGARLLYKTDYAVAVTGIAGPCGGSREKPVGTVWFGSSSTAGNFSYMCHFSGDRKAVRNATVEEALALFLRLMK